MAIQSARHALAYRKHQNMPTAKVTKMQSPWYVHKLYLRHLYNKICFPIYLLCADASTRPSVKRFPNRPLNLSPTMTLPSQLKRSQESFLQRSLLQLLARIPQATMNPSRQSLPSKKLLLRRELRRKPNQYVPKRAK